MKNKGHLPAFPVTRIEEVYDDKFDFEPGRGRVKDMKVFHSGLTIRQWYAGQALMALSTTGLHGGIEPSTCRAYARACFDMADAMIEFEASDTQENK